jgi:dTDP-4-amino-4,6-dideoxygalactose transaminase
MAVYAPGISLPATDELARTHLAIPMSAVLSAGQAAEVAETIRGSLARET